MNALSYQRMLGRILFSWLSSLFFPLLGEKSLKTVVSLNLHSHREEIDCAQVTADTDLPLTFRKSLTLHLSYFMCSTKELTQH